MIIVYEIIEFIASFIELFVLYKIYNILLSKQRRNPSEKADILLSMAGAGIVRLCNHVSAFSYVTMLIFAMVVGISTSSLGMAALGDTGFGLGITSVIIMNAVIAVFYMLFFFGCIDSRNRKIISYGNSPEDTKRSNVAFTPGLQCIRGQYQGQVMYLHGEELTFGSQAASAAIVIPNPHISHRHCSVRYNPGMGMYEVMDVSTNGVYVTVQNGSTQRIPAGGYVPCSRGSVISMGSMEQQFRLL